MTIETVIKKTYSLTDEDKNALKRTAELIRNLHDESFEESDYSITGDELVDSLWIIKFILNNEGIVW